MALIPCPECNQNISDKAPQCIHCGYPLKNVVLKTGSNQQTEEQPKTERPILAEDLSVGSKRWFGGGPLHGMFEGFASSDDRITSSSGYICFHKKGIVLNVGSQLNIHISQIINMQFVPNSQVFEKDKSVIARAVVGSLFLGPVGTIVAGMTGIGTKRYSEHSIIINYWDVEADMPYSVMFYAKDQIKARDLCNNVQRELASYKLEVKKKVKEEERQLLELHEKELHLESIMESSREFIKTNPERFFLTGGCFGGSILKTFKEVYGENLKFIMSLKDRKLVLEPSEAEVPLGDDCYFHYYLFDTFPIYRDGLCFLSRLKKNISFDKDTIDNQKLFDLSDFVGICSPELFEEISSVCGTEPNREELDYLERMRKAGL